MSKFESCSFSHVNLNSELKNQRKIEFAYEALNEKVTESLSLGKFRESPQLMMISLDRKAFVSGTF